MLSAHYNTWPPQCPSPITPSSYSPSPTPATLQQLSVCFLILRVSSGFLSDRTLLQCSWPPWLFILKARWTSIGIQWNEGITICFLKRVNIISIKLGVPNFSSLAISLKHSEDGNFQLFLYYKYSIYIYINSFLGHKIQNESVIVIC